MILLLGVHKLEPGVARVSRVGSMGGGGARTDTVDQTEPPVMPMPVPRFRRDHANADNPCHSLTRPRWKSTLVLRSTNILLNLSLVNRSEECFRREKNTSLFFWQDEERMRRLPS